MARPYSVRNTTFLCCLAVYYLIPCGFRFYFSFLCPLHIILCFRRTSEPLPFVEELPILYCPIKKTARAHRSLPRGVVAIGILQVTWLRVKCSGCNLWRKSRAWSRFQWKTEVRKLYKLIAGIL